MICEYTPPDFQENAKRLYDPHQSIASISLMRQWAHNEICALQKSTNFRDENARRQWQDYIDRLLKHLEAILNGSGMNHGGNVNPVFGESEWWDLQMWVNHYTFAMEQTINDPMRKGSGLDEMVVRTQWKWIELERMALFAREPGETVNYITGGEKMVAGIPNVVLFNVMLSYWLNYSMGVPCCTIKSMQYYYLGSGYSPRLLDPDNENSYLGLQPLTGAKSFPQVLRWIEPERQDDYKNPNKNRLAFTDEMIDALSDIRVYGLFEGRQDAKKYPLQSARIPMQSETDLYSLPEDSQ